MDGFLRHTVHAVPVEVVEKSVALATSAGGAAAGTIESCFGYLEEIQLMPGSTLDAGVDVTIVSARTGQTLWTATSGATEGKIIRPRALLQDTAGANLTAVYGRVFLNNEDISVTLANGGATKAGTFRVLLVPF